MNRKQLAFARKAVPVSVAIGVATVAAFFALMSTTHTVADPQPVREMTARDHAVAAQTAMHRICLTPEAMAVAGLTHDQSRDCLVLMNVYLAQSGNADRLHNRTLALNHALSELSKGIDPSADGVSARPDVGGLRDDLESTLAEMRAFVTAGLSSDQIAMLDRLHARRDLGLPIHFRAGADRSGAEWMRVRGMLATRRAAEGRIASTDETAQTFLAAVEGEPEIATATQRLADLLPSVRDAWQAHLDAE